MTGLDPMSHVSRDEVEENIDFEGNKVNWFLEGLVIKWFVPLP